MKNYFITGTDTGVGKTATAAAVVLATQACYWKPIQSGVADTIPDWEQVQELTNISSKRIIPALYTLQASLSPDQAAALEGIYINLQQCQLPILNQSLVVEGAGGICVPLNSDYLMLDFMQKLNFPVIIASRGTLGTINHTLLTIQALQQRNIPIQGIVFSGKLNLDNQKSIEKWTGIRTLFHIPYIENLVPSIFKTWVVQHANRIQEALT